MPRNKREAFICNIAAVPWRQFPDHFGGALSKPQVMPETAGSRHIDDQSALMKMRSPCRSMIC